MAETEFRELRGDYVANTGQTINLREYLDYFEPLGSALSRLPDGTGGPFVHRFTDSGGRTIGSIGWVVSAASKRFGAWTLWGMWSDRAIPAVALPLFWSVLSDPARTADLVGRANDEAARLFDRGRWPDLLDEVKTLRLRDDAIRQSLKTALERVWAVPPPHHHSIEVELPPHLLDVLPWLYILGPIDPTAAQLQPSRFNGAGYQYILDEHHPPARAAAALAFDVEKLVDTAAADVVAGWRMANELRDRRNRPRIAKQPTRTKHLVDTPMEANDMRRETSSTHEKTTSKAPVSATWRSALSDERTLADAAKVIYHIAVLALLGWIAFNVNVIRKQTIAERMPAAVSDTAPTDVTEPAPAPAVKEDLARTRIPRIAAALSASPPRGIRVSDTVLTEIAQGGTDATDKLARVAIEIFLRRNGCFARTEAADGRFSTAEQRAIRGCAVLQDERLIKNGVEPDSARAIDWLERLVEQ